MRNPSLNSLATFEAAARHLSFTRAARELDVLQPAVSRQVIELERLLATTLFERTKPLLTLTPDGNQLYHAVSGGLSQINEALDFLRARGRTRTLVVNATIGLASCFLMSRLAEFEAQYPEYRLELVTRDQNAAFDERGCDVLFEFDQPRDTGIRGFCLFPEEMIAVCAPDFEDVSTLLVDELVNKPLLCLASAQHRDDWKRYLQAAGLANPAPGYAQEYLSFMVYLQAILDGRGIGLGWSYLLDEHIAAGRLRIAYPQRVSGDRAYQVYLMERARRNPAAIAFFEWAESLALGAAAT